MAPGPRSKPFAEMTLTGTRRKNAFQGAKSSRGSSHKEFNHLKGEHAHNRSSSKIEHIERDLCFNHDATLTTGP